MKQETIRCGHKEVPHNAVQWRVATNRHPNTDGTAWGWIEGAPGNVTWSNESSAFNREKAGAAVVEHNRWLEGQRPLALRIFEATEAALKARGRAEEAQAQYVSRMTEYDAALEEVQRLEALRYADE